MNELATKYNPGRCRGKMGIATGWKTDYSNLSPTVENPYTIVITSAQRHRSVAHGTHAK